MKVASNDYSLVSPPLPLCKLSLMMRIWWWWKKWRKVKKGKRRQQKRRRTFKTISEIGWRPHESVNLPKVFSIEKVLFEILQISSERLWRNENLKKWRLKIKAPGLVGNGWCLQWDYPFKSHFGHLLAVQFWFHH